MPLPLRDRCPLQRDRVPFLILTCKFTGKSPVSVGAGALGKKFKMLVCAHLLLPHRQGHDGCALKNSEMGANFAGLLGYLHATGAGTDDADSTVFEIQALLRPVSRVIAFTLEVVHSCKVGRVCLCCKSGA